MDIRLIKIDDIDLSVRSLNALHNEGIETVGDLLGYTGDTLNQIRNLGKKSIDEILQIIDKYKEMESGSNLSSMEENSDIPLPELPENYGEWKESEEGKKCIISWLNENQLKISSLDLLSARSYNYLMLNGYTYVHQIIHMTREELMEIPRMSVQSAEEIINICRHFSEEKEEEIVAFYRESTISKNETNGIDIHDILYNTAFHDRVLQFLIANDIIIDKTDCSNRMKNQLHKNGFYNLSDLAFLTRYDFMNLPNMGKKTADEVVSFIERYLSDHKDRLVAFCNGDESALADDSQVGLHEIIHSKRYYDRFLQYIKQNDIEVDKLKCSKRARNQLKKNGLKNLSDIISITKNDLRALPHMGSKAADDIISVVDAYLADYEDRIIAFCKGDDAVLWDDHSIKNKILNVYNQIGFTGMSLLEIREKTGIPDLVTDERLKYVIGKMIADGLLEYVDFRCYRVYLRFSDYLASCTTVKERSKDIIHGRLHGETLESIAGIYNMTRERVRQIFNKEIQKVIDSYRVETGMEWFDEDYYRYFFETYAIDKKDAEKWLRLDSEIFNFLDMTGSKRGTGKLEDALNDYHNLDYGFRLKIKNYLNKDKLFLDGKWIDRKRWVLEDYAVRKYCRENVSFTEFCRIFNDFLREEEVQYDEDIYYTEAVERTRRNRLAESRSLLWKQNEQIRYYDIDGQDYTELLDTINLDAYEDIEYSTLKFIREYPEIMKKYDIRDQYELHNLLRKIVPDGSYHDIHFERTPVIRFGTFDRDSALLDLLIDNAPISMSDFAEIVSQEYGYDPGTVMGSYLQSFSAYCHNGIYSIDYKAMPYNNKEILQKKLTEDFYYIDEIRKMYASIFQDADIEEVNPYSLKLMGFSVLSRYVYQNYTTLDAYFRDVLTREDILDVTPFRKKFAYVVAFSQALYYLKKEREVLEFEPNQIIHFRKLEAAGITKQDLQTFCNEVYDFVKEGTYFSLQSIKKKGFTSELFELGFADWFYSSLLTSDDRFSFTNIFLNIILYKGEENITIKSFEENLIREHGSIDVYDLMTEMEEIYGCRIPDKFDVIYKVKETDVYYDQFLDRLYTNIGVYEKELDETEGI